MANSPRKTSSPRKSKPKKVLPIKRYKSITRKAATDNDKPEVHTNQGVSRVPWEPSNTTSIAEASPIASRQFNLDFKGWSKSKKDVIGQSSNGNANGGSKLSNEITNEKGSVKTNGSNSKSVKKGKNLTKQADFNTQEDVQSNSLLALDEWLTSDQMNIEVSEPTKTTQSNKRVRSKVKFIAKDDDLQDSLQSPKKPVRLRASPVKSELTSNDKGDKKANGSEKENYSDDFGIDDVDNYNGNEDVEEEEQEEEEEEEEVVKPPRNSRKDSIQLKKSKSSASSSSQVKQPPKKTKPAVTKPEAPVKSQKRVPIPLQQLTELSTDLLKEKKRTLELEQQLLYLKQEQKSLKPLPPLSEDITNDYSSELKAAQIKLEQINNEVNNLREEKASNLLTLIHNLRSKTDRKINSIQNLSSFALTKLNQSYILFFRLLTNIEFKVVSVSNLDLVRISNRYENLSIIDKMECKQTGKQGVHNYFLYTVQELNSNIKFIYEPIDPYEADHIPWQYLPEYLRDKLLFDLDQGANFLRVVFKVLSNGGEGKK